MKKLSVALFAVASAALLAPAAAHADEMNTRTYTNSEGTTWTFRTFPSGVTSVIRTGTAGWCSSSFNTTTLYTDGAMCGFPPGVGTTPVG